MDGRRKFSVMESLEPTFTRGTSHGGNSGGVIMRRQRQVEDEFIDGTTEGTGE